MNKEIVRAGTRRSRLAMAQTRHVLTALSEHWPELRVETTPYDTRGDRALGTLHTLPGGKGLFTSTLEDALRAHEIDIAVHSLKDLPVASAPKLTLGAILDRTIACDVLIAREAWTIHTLPRKASIGTGSRRRSAQLLHHRSDLTITPIRGNVDTRIEKMRRGFVDAVILAAVGLARLEMTDTISSYLPLHIVLPAPGQGALAVQCRADDADTQALLASLDNAAVRAATTAERTLLEALSGGCTTPIAAYARQAPGGQLVMDARIATPDGRHMIHVFGQGNDAQALGTELARKALQQGAAEVLAHA